MIYRKFVTLITPNDEARIPSMRIYSRYILIFYSLLINFCSIELHSQLEIDAKKKNNKFLNVINVFNLFKTFIQIHIEHHSAHHISLLVELNNFRDKIRTHFAAGQFDEHKQILNETCLKI